ncbi:MAG: hypothetical protein JWP64_482 [Pseudonocardia sp.]|nr:hypothetical protein [Pseudonocardia sp.]MCU1625533.1 hypothetical protein [Pseudonocardia sp.]MDT7704284.1 hypothetical protein [Pseudonocardiales bacterium]
MEFDDKTVLVTGGVIEPVRRRGVQLAELGAAICGHVADAGSGLK